MPSARPVPYKVATKMANATSVPWYRCSIIDCGSELVTLSVARIPTATRAKIVASVMTRREAENAASKGTSASQIVSE